jgi:RNase P/RNase MRP subunit POP5
VTAASTTTASAVAATTPAGATAFTLRTRFIHHQRAAQKILAVKRFDGFIRFGVVANLGETETARLSRETIAQQRERIRLHANFRKQRRYLLFRGLERQITDIQFLHGRSPFASGKCPGAKHEAEETGNRPRGQRLLTTPG